MKGLFSVMTARDTFKCRDKHFFILNVMAGSIGAKI